ncbi:MAG: GAF domain-containing protein [Anaerolineae bacterium]
MDADGQSVEHRVEHGLFRRLVPSLGPTAGSELGQTTRQVTRRMTLEGLGPASLVLGLLYVVFAVGHTTLPPAVARVMVPTALVSGLLLLALHLALRNPAIRRVNPHIFATAIAAIVLVNSLLHLGLTDDPLQTTNLILLLVGAGFLFLSTPILVGLMVATLLGWGAVAYMSINSPPWRHFGFGLVSAAALGFILHAARLRSYRLLESLREQAESQAGRLRERAAHLEALITVGHSINSLLDLDALLEHVVETLHTRFGYDYAGIFLADEAGEYLVARAGTGDVGRQLVADAYRLKLGATGLVGWASRYREPVCVNDVSKDSRYILVDFLGDTQSEMVIPLETGDTLLGVLDIQSAQRDAFSDDDLRVCHSLADQVAIAIRNASRYELEQTRRSLTETLYAVGRALSQTLDTSQVLDMILDGLIRIVPSDRSAVLLERDGALEIVAARGFPPDINSPNIRIPIKPGDVYDRIRRTKEPLAVPDIRELADWEYVDNLPPANSWVGLPLTYAEDQVIGMLSLAREAPAPYTSDEIVLGNAFAGQAGAALHNARLYMQLSEAYRRLSRLDRAKSDFITLASHELRTPLTLITGYSQMMLDEAAIREDPMLATMVDGLALGADRLQSVIERMMDLAEIESRSMELRFVRLNIESLLQDVIDGFAEVVQERSLKIHLEHLATCPDIDGDRMALAKVFSHLIVNAIKFTPDGGDIWVSASAVPSGPGERTEPSIEIAVTDNGIGIDDAHHDRIFDKFYQAGKVNLHSSGTVKFQGGGPGLGLAIVKGIVEAHRGRVWVESPGYDPVACPGSTFYVLLPMRQPRDAAEFSWASTEKDPALLSE